MGNFHSIPPTLLSCLVYLNKHLFQTGSGSGTVRAYVPNAFVFQDCEYILSAEGCAI